MWNRKKIKQNAIIVLFKNYFKSVFVAAILFFTVLMISDIPSIISDAINLNNPETEMTQVNNTNSGKYHLENNLGEDTSNTGYVPLDELVREEIQARRMEIEVFIQRTADEFNIDVEKVRTLYIEAVFVAVAINLMLRLFVFNVLYVGGKRWFIISKTDDPRMGEMVYHFKNGYLNTVKTMFLKDLYLMFWFFLFIIPGFIKMYEYRMVPYLIAENPQMNTKEAFQISKQMMNGKKWDVFVFDLSFVGWFFAGFLYRGIPVIVFSNPYYQIAKADLYTQICMLDRNNQNNFDGMNM